MCDYSLFTMPNRLAVEGEELVVHRFPTGSIGLTSPADLRRMEDAGGARDGGGDFLTSLTAIFIEPGRALVPAVCVPPGARLNLHGLPEALCREYGVGKSEEVVFIELSAEANAYRDAIRFANGAAILLQGLPPGLGMKVVSLESAAHASAEGQEELFLYR